MLIIFGVPFKLPGINKHAGIFLTLLPIVTFTPSPSFPALWNTLLEELKSAQFIALYFISVNLLQKANAAYPMVSTLSPITILVKLLQ